MKASNKQAKFDYSDLDENDRPHVDYNQLMQYRLTFYTRTAKGGRLKVYSYYWESPEYGQEIYKVRTNYIEFLTYKYKDAPHFSDGVLYHRDRQVRVYDPAKERLVTRFTPVLLRKTNPHTKREKYEVDYNFFSEKARRNGTRVAQIK